MHPTAELEIIFGFYGLAFFTLGVAVLIRSLPLPHSATKMRFLALGAFGLIHGFFEWVTLANVVGIWPTSEFFRQGMALISYGALLAFGLGRHRWCYPVIGLVLLAAFSAQIAFSSLAEGAVMGELVSRWGIAVPASLIAAYQFAWDRSLRPDTVFARRGTLFGAAALGLYALTQLFTTPASFFPASVFNSDQFIAVTGVSVLVARSLCGLLLTATAIAMLGSFDEAMRRSASALRSRQGARYLTMVQSQRECVTAIARDCTLLDMNDAGLAMVGADKLETIAGRSVLDLILPEFRQAYCDGVARVYRGETVEQEYQMYGAEGQVRWADQVASPVMDPDEPDRVMEMIAVIHDVTDLRRSLDHMTALKAAAEAANQAKSEFLSNMSHEIRTPLNGVLGMLALLKRRVEDEELSEFVGIADQSGRNLLTIIDDILDFNRIEAGKMVIRDAPFTLDALEERLIGAFRQNAEERGLVFDYRSSIEPERTYRGDIGRVVQIVSNLLSNAIKFTQEGQVTLEIDALEGRDGLRVRVSDTGIGIPSDKLTTVFGRFVQADSSSTREFGGTGLGLAIISGLLAEMGGDIGVDSELGKGTVFTVTLPMARCDGDAKAIPDAPAEAAPATTTRRRILIAEDNRLNMHTVRAFLAPHGFECVFVPDGEQAIRAAQTSVFDLLILDIQMPNADGLEALAAIRSMETRSEEKPVPAIACTANAFADQIDTYLAAGFDAVITKPLDIDAFEKTVFSVLEPGEVKAEAGAAR